MIFNDLILFQQALSKLGNGTFAQPLGITAGGVNYTKLTAEQQKSLDTYVKSLGVPPGPPTQQGIYATPEFTGNPYPSEVLKPVEENQEPPKGWPRNPMFNAPGDVPGPPVQFGPPVQPATVKPGEGFTGIGMPENDIFYFHSDHLGSTSYISTKNGSISQHVEYIAFGEVLFEEHSSSFNTPYLFNGKELDRETNLTYYGVRYLDMKTSLWLSVDPLMFDEDFFDDPESTNGGAFNSFNLASYTFSYNNPVKYIDPDGECPNCVTAAAGALIGAIVGGAMEAGIQLYKNGKVDNWKAVGGAAVQGAVVGAVAGFTGGANLLVTAGVSAGANVVGGVASRAIQGQETTVSDVVVDGGIGAVFGVGGKLVGKAVENTTNNLSRSAKGKLGETMTEIKYASRGYFSSGKAEILTGGKTPTGREARAFYDHDMENFFTKRKLIVESKYNTSGLTKNQRDAIINKGVNVIIDRTTSQGLGNAASTAAVRIGGGVAAQRNTKKH